MWRSVKLRLATLILCAAAIAAPSAALAATNIQTTICSQFETPSITAPASGASTANSSIHIAGYGEPGMAVYIKKNGVGSGVTTAGSDGSYAINVPLDVGINVLTANQSNECNTVKTSEVIQALRSEETEQPSASVATQPSPTKPTEITKLTTTVPVPVLKQTPASDVTQATTTEEENLTPAQKQIIAEPKPNEEITSDRTWVTGKTTPITKVDIYVNKTIAASVLSDSVGIYGALINMKPGKNTIQVQATTPDGNVITVRTIDVHLVKKETSLSKEDKMILKNAQDTVGLLIIAAIGLGGTLIILTILWHTYHLKREGRRHA